MKCYLIRHGADDTTRRGGWSDAPLTEQGVEQVEKLADSLVNHPNFRVTHLFSSDIVRAAETAQIIGHRLDLPVEYLPQFRETNNGCLAGMKNEEALIIYPGLFWNTLGWDECYPNGESPRQFYERIKSAWEKFKPHIEKIDEDVMLVTHGGVINVIYHIENGLVYSNKGNEFRVGYAQMMTVDI